MKSLSADINCAFIRLIFYRFIKEFHSALRIPAEDLRGLRYGDELLHRRRGLRGACGLFLRAAEGVDRHRSNFHRSGAKFPGELRHNIGPGSHPAFGIHLPQRFARRAHSALKLCLQRQLIKLRPERCSESLIVHTLRCRRDFGNPGGSRFRKPDILRRSE